MATTPTEPAHSMRPTDRSRGRGWRFVLAACFVVSTAGGVGPLVARDAMAETESEAQYLRLHPDFVVNLQGPGKPHFLLVSIDVMGRDPDTMVAAEHHSAAIRHELVLLLSDQEYAAVNTPDGRQQLQLDALAAANDVLAREDASRKLEGLFFSSFVVE